MAAGLFLWAAWRRKKAGAAFGNPELVKRLSNALSGRRRRWKAALYTVAVLLIGLALAGPRMGTRLREVNREGVDVLIALDVSNSMMAEDVAPNRLKRAKFEITKLVDRLAGDRVGLMIFGGDSFLQCPLTLDYSALKLFLDVSDPSQMPVQGTNFEAMMEGAVKAFALKGTDKDSKDSRSKVLLVVSDGESHLGNLSEVHTKAAEAGITLFSVGVGETSGATIPVYLEGRRTDEPKTDRQGNVVVSKLEETGLMELAKDGAYYRIARTTSNLTEFSDALSGLERTKFGSARFAAYEERFQIPLALGLLLLFGDLFFSEYRRRKFVGIPSSEIRV